MFRYAHHELGLAVLQLPKTDLHCHLDGSLRPLTVLELAKQEGVDLGVDNISELKKKLVCGEKVQSLPQFLAAFDLTTKVLQSPSALQRAAFELAEDAAQENVWHLEVRFAPKLFLQKGMHLQDVVSAVQTGLKQAEQSYGISTGIILCALRIDPPQDHVNLAKAALSLTHLGVVGLDLAHAERGRPAKDHAEAFSLAKAGGLFRTVHAGEDFGPSSIHQAIDYCHAQRIGHGLTLYQDPGLQERMKALGIAIECCPSSNYQISLLPRLEHHPVKSYIERGLCATLATDNRLLTGISVTDEYDRAARLMGMSWPQLVQLARNGFAAAFLPPEKKQALLKRFEDQLPLAPKSLG